MRDVRIDPGNALYEVRDIHPASSLTIANALNTDAVARRILRKGDAPEPGQPVGSRLNLNVLTHTGVAVYSIHRASSLDGYTKGYGLYRGEVISYLGVVTLRDCYFNVNQTSRERIASGASSKTPMASVDGIYVEQPDNPNFNGLEVRFNPHHSHLFIDPRNMAVAFAEEVTCIGHRVYARGLIRYFTKEDAPKRAGKSRSIARLMGR